VKYLRGFAWFWWDFIVGDSMVLAAGAALTLVVAFLLAHYVAAAAAEVVLPAGIIATLLVSLRKP
jgi:hypothetical protein